MSEFTGVDRLHRLEKLLLQNGSARSQEEARAILSSYSMQFVVGPEMEGNQTLQVALLTAINTAARAVHGEVRVIGELDRPLLVHLPGCFTIADAVTLLGGVHGSTVSDAPALLFGSAEPPSTEISLRAAIHGWRGGVLPADEDPWGTDASATSLAAAVAGAVGVSELFQALCGVNARAGRRRLGYSVWDPSQDWMSEESDGPELERLPEALWVIGLGHLGQSLLWNLGFLPYDRPNDVRLILQDFDQVKPANVSTSPLTFERDSGRMKTRVVAQWMECLGFSTRLVERAFAANFEPNSDEPRLAFCGVDNREARAALEGPVFTAVVEAGLGTGEEYLAFQLHTFPGPVEAAERWSQPRVVHEPPWSEGLERFAEAEHLDDCGKTELSGLQVASSYVGIVTTAFAIGQMLRPLHGAVMHGSLSGTLASSGAPASVEGEVGKTALRYGSVERAA